jgi:hypothetical protein
MALQERIDGRDATKQPAGQISKFVSSLPAKNFALPFRGKSLVYSSRLVPQEGRLAIVTKRGAGCGGRSGVDARFMRADERR